MFQTFPMNNLKRTSNFAGGYNNPPTTINEGERISKRLLPPTLDDVVFIKRSELAFRKRIGRGSFGTVFKGRLYDQDVAIKVFSVQNSMSRVGLLVESEEKTAEQLSDIKKKQVADLVVALEREVRILKSLSFGPIVQFYGVCLEPAAIVTEYCAHLSLFDFIGIHYGMIIR